MIRLMSFNIRFPSKDDHGNLWSERRDMVAEMLRETAPDVIGMQEAYAEQITWLLSALPDYFAVARERHGGLREEHNPVFLRRDRFVVQESGTFWLSDTPEVPESVTWLPGHHPRIATWARVADMVEGREVVFVNTHMQLSGDEQRGKSANLIWHRMQAFGDVPTALTGDFNAIPGSRPYSVLVGEIPAEDGSRADFVDCHDMADAAAEPAGTFHKFSGEPRPGRIDWIMVRNGLTPQWFKTLTWNREGRYVSDHFPVMTGIEYPPRP